MPYDDRRETEMERFRATICTGSEVGTWAAVSLDCTTPEGTEITHLTKDEPSLARAGNAVAELVREWAIWGGNVSVQNAMLAGWCLAWERVEP